MADLPLADRHDTVLPAASDDQRTHLQAALASEPPERKTAVGTVVADDPAFIEGWATLATLADEPIEAYAYARVGYHRGLDALRGRGWGGTGFVRWSQPSNRPFLTCLVRLRNAASEIGEVPEVQRIDEFLLQLDPDWDVSNVER